MADECSFCSDEDCDSITITCPPVLQHANRKRKQESDALLLTSKSRKESSQWVLSLSLYYLQARRQGGHRGTVSPQTAVRLLCPPVHEVILWLILGMYSARTSIY